MVDQSLLAVRLEAQAVVESGHDDQCATLCNFLTSEREERVLSGMWSSSSARWLITAQVVRVAWLLLSVACQIYYLSRLYG